MFDIGGGGGEFFSVTLHGLLCLKYNKNMSKEITGILIEKFISQHGGGGGGGGGGSSSYSTGLC